MGALGLRHVPNSDTMKLQEEREKAVETAGNY